MASEKGQDVNADPLLLFRDVDTGKTVYRIHIKEVPPLGALLEFEEVTAEGGGKVCPWFKVVRQSWSVVEAEHWPGGRWVVTLDVRHLHRSPTGTKRSRRRAGKGRA